MHQFVQKDGAQKEQRLLPLGKIAEIGIELLGDTGRYRYGIGVLGLKHAIHVFRQFLDFQIRRLTPIHDLPSLPWR